MNELSIGAAAGAAATAPMTWAMEVMHRSLPQNERYPLPPRQITEKLTGKVGVRKEMNEPEQFWLTVASHFGYGATVGAFYAPIARRLDLPPVLGGTLYGLCVWAGSYLGVLPALSILPSATKQPPRRTALMIAAHVVWGSALGIFVDMLHRDSKTQGKSALGAARVPAGSLR